MSYKVHFWLFFLFLLLTNCSGGNKNAAVQNQAAASAAPVFLEGDTSALAISALVDKSPSSASKSAILEDGTLLDRLDAILKVDVTIAQVNEAIRSIGGLGILSMKKGYPYITIGVPPQKDLGALKSLGEQLYATGAFEYVFSGMVREANLAPARENLNGALWNHLHPIRMHAAWSVKEAAKNCDNAPVPVLIADRFRYEEDGSSNIAGFAPNFQLIGDNPPAGVRFHGNNVVNMFASIHPKPECLFLRGVQLHGLSFLQENQYMLESIHQLLQEFPNAPFLINMSFGNPLNDSLYSRMYSAVPFEDMMSGFLANDHLLIVSSAGNNRQRGNTIGARMALYTSDQNMSILDDPLFENLFAQREQLFPGNGISEQQYESVQRLIRQRETHLIPPAFNVLMVGSSDNLGTALNPELSQESSFSNIGADLLVVGEGIPSVEEGRGDILGTSFSAPQVTGFVSYLWSLSPELRGLSVRTTKNLLMQNKWPGTEIVDAYASVLSLDEAQLPTPATAPMRLALMDVDNNGRFDEVDVENWLETIHFHNDLPVQERLDYSRYDLNGDGYIGGRAPNDGAISGRRSPRFDLDRVGSQKFGAANYGQVTKNILGAQITFDETQLRDLDILCYYTYSDLYTGSEQYRNGVDDIFGIGLIAYLCNQQFRPRNPDDPLPPGPGDPPNGARLTILDGSDFHNLSTVRLQIDSPRGFENSSLRVVLRRGPYHGERGLGAWCAEPGDDGVQTILDMEIAPDGCAVACQLPAFNTRYCSALDDCPCEPHPDDPTKCSIPGEAFAVCQGPENCNMRNTLYFEFRDRLNWRRAASRCFLGN